MKQRMQRGGSVVGFIIACVIAALLLVGGVYAVRHAGWFDSSNDNVTSKVTESPREKDSKKSSNKSTEKQKATSSSDQKSHTTKNSEKKQPEPQSNYTETSKSHEDLSKSQVDQSDTKPAEPADNSANSLPHTGLSDALATVLGVGCLTASLVAYERSRHLA